MESSVAWLPKRRKTAHDAGFEDDAKMDGGNTENIERSSREELETQNQNFIDLTCDNEVEDLVEQAFAIPSQDDMLADLSKLMEANAERRRLLDELLQWELPPIAQPASPASQTIQPFASLPSFVSHAAQSGERPPQQDQWSILPSFLRKSRKKEVSIEANLHYRAPKSLSKGTGQFLESSPFTTGDECPICMGDFRTMPTVKLVKCGHLYHRECIEEALKHCPRCPTCRLEVVEPRGKSPSGTMLIQQTNQRCGGVSDADGTIVLNYRLHGGRQQVYHDNPGVKYHGTTRIGYLPNNEEGRELLKRLKYAFMHGLSFSVGTSLTTGRPNQVTWSSIHHKTCLHGGVHGFPDPSFFANCSEELNALGVPASRDLD